MTVIANPPFPAYLDVNGSPINDGYLYFGVANQNPETNPITVYWDAAYSEPASQPIRTSGGFAVRNGTPANLYVSTDFSLTVRDKNRRLVYSRLIAEGQFSAEVDLQFSTQTITATSGQTVFSLSTAYTPGNQSLAVYHNGSRLVLSQDYLETSSTSITLLIGANAGDVLQFVTATPINPSSMGAAAVAYIPAGAGAVTTNVQAKLRETVSVLDFGAVGDGVTDDTAAIQAALDSGYKSVLFPPGTYLTAGNYVSATNNLSGITFEAGSRLLLLTGSNRIALDIQKPVFSITGTADVKSTGSMSDGNNTVGLRSGTSSAGVAYIRVEAVRFENFSGKGVVLYQPVYCGIERITGYSSTYGLSIEPDSALNTGTTVEIGPSYISGCTRGINLSRCSWVTLREPILEFCGSASTTNGAFHIENCANVTIIDRYGEQNARNLVKIDSIVLFINGSMFASTGGADVVTYSGVPFNSRGTTQLNGSEIRARRLNFDNIDNQDLIIGSNLTVPTTGGSVIFGNETRSVAQGTLTSATWTTVSTIPASEYASTVNTNAFYEYVCYAGSADLSTGFDAGTFMNGVLRSYSGTLPAWLRFNSGNIQMNVTSSSYGLTYKIVLRRVFPG